MHWLYLIIAGTLEVGWLISLKHTEGFTQIKPLIGYVVFGLGNVYFFSLALKSLSMGLAFSVWMSVAVIGTVIYEGVAHNEPYSWFRVCCIFIIIIGIVGLKISSDT